MCVFSRGLVARLREYVCAFFFSSRRRHTRFDCDWSSDVCSSDLVRRALISGCALGLATGWNISNTGAIATQLSHRYGVGLATIGLFTTALFTTHLLDRKSVV